MFLAYIQQNLAPTLPQGDVVIMDNLASLNVAGVQEAIERKGARLLIFRRNSPDLNPIEMACAKLKALLRAKALRIEELWKALGNLVGCFSATE